MLCYPDVVKINQKIVMFYCGNGFRQGGTGYAELQDAESLQSDVIER